MITMRLTAPTRAQMADPAYTEEGAAPRIQLVKFLTTFGVGGTEKQVANLTKRMDRRSFDVSFACMSRWGELIQEIEDRQGIEVSEYPLESFYDLTVPRSCTATTSTRTFSVFPPPSWLGCPASSPRSATWVSISAP
jgi:hypothetical protein